MEKRLNPKELDELGARALIYAVHDEKMIFLVGQYEGSEPCVKIAPYSRGEEDEWLIGFGPEGPHIEERETRLKLFSISVHHHNGEIKA